VQKEEKIARMLRQFQADSRTLKKQARHIWGKETKTRTQIKGRGGLEGGAASMCSYSRKKDHPVRTATRNGW